MVCIYGMNQFVTVTPWYRDYTPIMQNQNQHKAVESVPTHMILTLRTDVER